MDKAGEISRKRVQRPQKRMMSFLREGAVRVAARFHLLLRDMMVGKFVGFGTVIGSEERV